MDTFRFIIGFLGLVMFVIGVIVRALDNVIARTLGRAGQGLGCMGTLVSLGLIFGGLGLMAVGGSGFLIDSSSTPSPALDAGHVADAGGTL